jgi:hypothetical protein
MREPFFILLIVLVLFGLTAIRYRKQIAGMIGLARALKDAKDAAAQGGAQSSGTASLQLVNCSKCDVWVPASKATRRGTKHICSACL